MRLDEIPCPVPETGELLVAVKAAGVGPWIDEIDQRWHERREHGRDAPEWVWQQRRSRQLALTYEWIEDWHRAIPRRYENYTRRLLEKFVQRCDQ